LGKSTAVKAFDPEDEGADPHKHLQRQLD